MGRLTIPILALVALTAPDTAQACGGFFCNGGGGGPTPIVQAAERVIFEKRADGTIRAYIQIRYDQTATTGLSWIIPVTARPTEVGIADAAMFDQLDQATSPQFRFVNNGFASPGGGGGLACGASDATAVSGRAGPGIAGTVDVDGVRVWDAARVGNYSTATISGDSAALLLDWLSVNGYDIPTEATAIIEQYVLEGHLFAAFKYDPLDGVGSGTLDPIVLTYAGLKPCVPIRITAIASTPILDIMVMAFGEQRAGLEGGFVLTEPDYSAIRQDFSMGTQTTYGTEVLRAIQSAGGRAFVTEFAGPSTQLTGITDIEAQAIVNRHAYVTRFYTRMAPEDMTIDPEFIYPGGADVPRLHVIDITPRSAARATSSPLRYAWGPGALVVAALALVIRRRRR